ncbi:(R)-stereoselective amidase [bacterium BMS3Bbin03]|nr:(R)-stereoselective amidase [bacterium BMS3Bbin03]
MKLAVYQFEPLFGDIEANVQKIEHAVNSVEFDLLILPELCTTGYQFNSHEEVAGLSETIPGGLASKRLETLAARKNGFIAAGIAEKSEKGFYNSAILVGPEGYIGKYRKIHLFDEEKLFFLPGNLGFPVFDIEQARIGLMICFDWIFPEAARTLALKGADILCQPANLVLSYCQQAMVTRAVENRTFIVTANRIGTEARGGKPPLNFTGMSQIISPKGEKVLGFSETEEKIKIVDINPEDAHDKWITPRNQLFKDRRGEFYEL